MECYGVHGVLAITPAGILWDPWDFSNQISSNPMEPYETQGILAIKSHQTQWNLLGSIMFYQSNLINPMGP